MIAMACCRSLSSGAGTQSIPHRMRLPDASCLALQRKRPRQSRSAATRTDLALSSLSGGGKRRCFLRASAARRGSLKLARFRAAKRELTASENQILFRQLQPIQISQHGHGNFVGMEKSMRHLANFFSGHRLNLINRFVQAEET